MILKALGLHGPEGTEADVQRDRGNLDPLTAQGVEHGGGEVQAGGGRGHGSRLARVDRLVARRILGALLRPGSFGAGNVGRQGCAAVLVEQLPERSLSGEPYLYRAIFRTGGLDLGRNRTVAHGGAQTGTPGPAAAAERLPAHGAGILPLRYILRRFERLQQQELDLAAGVAPVSLEARGKDPRVVDDHEIARAQIGGQIGESAMPERTAAAVEHQHARRGAFGGRMLRDQLGRQVVVVVGGQQSRCPCGAAAVGSGSRQSAVGAGRRTHFIPALYLHALSATLSLHT